MKLGVAFIISTLLCITGCNNRETETIQVTATAYNSLASQTHENHPTITAWGDKLKPGMKAIAVSRDLIKLGLKHKTEVEIEGLPGTYIVLDKMNKRWKRKIDIYMGDDLDAANQWGKRKVIVSWEVESK